ncbi:hypothetical protein [Rufibacter sp. XAAS-G3-1]|uniref:hypothetical protein n=1 Tax=Rufibacter sp. XAAS-G3-1 TaxID=2729134 RepID=UPI0015E79B2A|nr:hypothetical protein [Rufibacter sp. XAAS-G3-1]
MEWGTFFTVVVTLYLVYYGFVFLLDLLTKGRPVRLSGEGIEYNMSNLLDEEEVSQVLGSKAFEEPTVTAYNTQAQAEEEYPEDSEEEYPEEEYLEDSEGEYAEEEEYTDEELEPEEVVKMTVIEEPKPEEVVEMAVMGEPMQPNNYLKMIREQAMQNALSTSKTIFS